MHWLLLLIMGAILHAHPLVDAAREQIGQTLWYDPSYVRLSYPMGDLPIERGVCSDVLVRALRVAYHLDLQRAIHEDRLASPHAYPQGPIDTHIDHRRVRNIQIYLRSHGYALEITHDPRDYHAGDILTCRVGGSLPHVMIVSDRIGAEGIPMIIHNIGRGTQEEDALFTYPIDGHYRIR